MYLLGYNMSVAVAVGFIALLGVAAEIGVVILIYIDQALAAATTRREAAGERVTGEDLRESVIQGALMRVRPIMMTVAAIIGGLLPIMWGTGTGSEVMRRIAAPMVGGMVSVTVLTLIVIPAIYAVVKEYSLQRPMPNRRTHSDGTE
jgi:Cu(I)/Ag(I) efflux system membrane protein CusA/SilA